MNAGSRHDFFTVIHKGQRKELFAATVLAGTINWEDATAANDFVALWSKLTSMLEAHAAHEHKHFFPLLAQRAPEVVAQVEAAHEDLERELITLTDVIAVAASKRSHELGLAIYRQISAFVANYLLHILDEETIVMPAIWQHCTDTEINVARLAFKANQSPAGVVRSRRAILTAITQAELVTTALEVERGSTEGEFNAFMTDARQLLEPPEWNLLHESMIHGKSGLSGKTYSLPSRS
jgi:Hemerythrin HHE cation binding domain